MINIYFKKTNFGNLLFFLEFRSHISMNAYYSKIIDQKLNQLSQLKKMIAEKLISLTA